LQSFDRKTIFDEPEMLVSPLVPGDTERVRTIATATSANVDVEAELGRSWALFWVARDAPELDAVAFLLAWAVADELHLIHVATHPEFRRQGAARALLEVLLDHAMHNKTRLVLLEVRRSNRAAIRLYRALGFSKMGVRRAYYSDNEDAIEMMLSLDPVTGRVQPGQDEIGAYDS
jgi:ribosomal-protein-alanine N-acetyltransferase